MPVSMLIEPGGSDLAPGLLLFPVLVAVTNGVACVPVVKIRVSGSSVYLRQILGMRQLVEVVKGENQCHLMEEGEKSIQVAVVASQVTIFT